MKKIIALVLVCLTLMSLFCTVASANQTTDWVRFVPTKMTVTSSKISVEGYFVNFNPDRRVNYFTNFNLKLYHNGTKLFDADFDDQINCTVSPLGMKKHTFNVNMNSGHSATLGTYTCDDSYYTVWNGNVNTSTTN